MITTLIRIDAQDASGGALPIFLSSHDLPQACHLGGDQWDPAIAELPTFALDFFGGGFQGQVTAPTTGFAVATIGLPAFGVTPAARARFADARVRIWVGDITSAATADLGPLTLRFDGRLTGEPDVDDAARIARFDAAVQDSWADDPLLDLFAGTGGIEGPVDLTGQAKPLVLGNVRFAGGVLIDSVDNVWMVSNGPVQAVNAAYDRLASLGPSSGNHADLAALLAATIPNGSWATCLAQGLVRLGAPPDGRVSFDVSGSNAGTGGYVRRAGAIIRRIADLAGGTVNAASLTALDTARPYNLAIQLREQVTPREIIAQIADSVAAVAGVSLTGQLFAQALTIAASGEVLNGDGTSALRVGAVEELAKASPAWRLATEAELTFELHTAEEAAFNFRWQGEYSATRLYRSDDVVTGPDGAAWAYINTAPAAGQALPVWPVVSNTYWRVFQAPAAAALAPGNANRVPFSRFEGGRGWVASGNFAPAPFLIQFEGRFFIASEPTFTAANQDVYLFNAPRFQVLPTERLSVSGRVQAFTLPSGGSPSFWQFYIEYYTSAGAIISNTPIGSGTVGVNESVLQSGFSTVPATAATAQIVLQFKSSGAGLARLAILEPMVTSAATLQTEHASYSPGPNARDGADPNSDIGIDSDGRLNGIGLGAGEHVNNRGVVLSGLLAARPASGAYIGQNYVSTDTREFFRWDGFNWLVGSDVTLTLGGPTSDILSYTSTGTLDPSDQLPRTYVYTLSNRSGLLTSGITWNYRIIEGMVNGFAASGTLRSMSAISGAGQFALSDLGSNTAQVEIIGTVGGGSVSGFLQLTKVFAPPNTSGGGGGGGGAASASQSSGFLPVNSPSYATVSNDLQVTSTGTTQTGTVNLTFSPPLDAESASTIEVQLDRWDGSTWVSFGAAESASSQVIYDSELARYIRSRAVFNFSRTFTITAGTNQRIRVRARRSSGTISHSTAGTLTLSA